ncbi:MAG TPA: hypothetical protein VE891_02035 [Allosphingosinicella sp.]|nr:hypothetical protein [Allosphingosinicella sp.]
MKYLGGLLGGVAGNGAFWTIQQLLLKLPSKWEVTGYIISTMMFAAMGYWIGSSRKGEMNDRRTGDVASDMEGSSLDVLVERIEVDPDASVASRLKSSGHVKVRAKDISSKG